MRHLGRLAGCILAVTGLLASPALAFWAAEAITKQYVKSPGPLVRA